MSDEIERKVPVDNSISEAATDYIKKQKREAFKLENPGIPAPGETYSMPYKPGQYEKIFGKDKKDEN